MTTTDSDLRLSLHEAMAPAPTGAPDDDDLLLDHPWHVTDSGSASWALRRLGGARRAIERVDAIRAEEQARLDEWYKNATASDQRTVAFMEGRLATWLRGLLEADKKTRSYRYPGGTLRATKSTKVIVTDETALIAWARDNGLEDLVVEEKITAKVSGVKGMLQTNGDGDLVAVTEDGVAVPGIIIEINDNPKAEPTLLDEG